MSLPGIPKKKGAFTLDVLSNMLEKTKDYKMEPNFNFDIYRPVFRTKSKLLMDIEGADMWTMEYAAPISQQTSQVVTLTAPEETEKADIAAYRGINRDDAIAIGIYEACLRNRVKCNSMDVDLDWLNENCTGFFVHWNNAAIDNPDLIGFELFEDLTLFRLKFHAA